MFGCVILIPPHFREREDLETRCLPRCIMNQFLIPHTSPLSLCLIYLSVAHARLAASFPRSTLFMLIYQLAHT